MVDGPVGITDHVHTLLQDTVEWQNGRMSVEEQIVGHVLEYSGEVELEKTICVKRLSRRKIPSWD